MLLLSNSIFEECRSIYKLHVFWKSGDFWNNGWNAFSDNFEIFFLGHEKKLKLDIYYNKHSSKTQIFSKVLNQSEQVDGSGDPAPPHPGPHFALLPPIGLQ